ncbi:hypothetical protein NNC19_09930 [Clostridium sp. SHJSY1]|uniref:hypothetical protein n=1 Tax=Clostridium sp. SHJSY1 TaxID=2942483 RepID=UPI002875479F|nr:hypothetical protein [Clostridium sp. SHJSY1]MDS0525997.1 hypothetical protein [Clostridium sp. SHJSY1]
MKKIKFGVVLLVVVLGIGIYYYKFISDFSCLADIKGDITSTQSNGSEATFQVEKGEKIKFVCNSVVQQGNLKITLNDANGRAIKDFDINKKYSEEFTFESHGEYGISAKYSDFIGSFNVKCK